MGGFKGVIQRRKGSGAWHPGLPTKLYFQFHLEQQLHSLAGEKMHVFGKLCPTQFNLEQQLDRLVQGKVRFPAISRPIPAFGSPGHPRAPPRLGACGLILMHFDDFWSAQASPDGPLAGILRTHRQPAARKGCGGWHPGLPTKMVFPVSSGAAVTQPGWGKDACVRQALPEKRITCSGNCLYL
eukprot:gene16384-biopygen20276